MSASAARVRAVRFPSIVLCILLGFGTTIAIAWAAAAFVPLAPLSRQLRISVTGAGRVQVWERSEGWFALPPTSGVVALDGDHLQPWLFQLKRLGAQRLIWFEKGRVYSRRNVGPPGASSAAVTNWSLATGTRTDPGFRKGELALPASLRRKVEASEQPVWGVMEDRRGWPLLALKWQAVAPRYEIPLMSADERVYAFRWAIDIPEPQSATSGFADLRALPIMPVWVGLIGNTLFFAGAWWVVLLAPRSLRARLRRRRGRCPACAYDLCRDLAGGCPECGWNRRAGAARAEPDTGGQSA